MGIGLFAKIIGMAVTKLPLAPRISAPAIGELAKPWPLIGTLLLLFTSLSGNFYLVWIFAELRKRYRALLVK